MSMKHLVQAALADMTAAISHVPVGVVALMKRQREGWAYIRP